MSTVKLNIHIAGIMSYELIQVRMCARELKAKYPDTIGEVTEQVFFRDPWTHFLSQLQQEKKGDFMKHHGHLIVYLNDDQYLGGANNFLEWALQ